MFTGTSRYKDLNIDAAGDAGGIPMESNIVRFLPEVTGTFLHTLEEGERLDHLAFKYYEDTKRWWFICDANPGFQSPLALVGKEPVVTSRFTVTYNPGGGTPPWHNLIKTLNQKTGVRAVSMEREMRLEKETVDYTDPGTEQVHQVEVNVEAVEYTAVVTYNRLNLSVDELKDFIEKAGFTVVETESIGRTGKQIIIPPDVVD